MVCRTIFWRVTILPHWFVGAVQGLWSSDIWLFHSSRFFSQLSSSESLGFLVCSRQRQLLLRMVKNFRACQLAGPGRGAISCRHVSYRGWRRGGPGGFHGRGGGCWDTWTFSSEKGCSLDCRPRAGNASWFSSGQSRWKCPGFPQSKQQQPSTCPPSLLPLCCRSIWAMTSPIFAKACSS